MTIWVLEHIGYDIQGENARLFSTPDLAKAQVKGIEWVPDEDVPGGWVEADWDDHNGDVWVIYPREVDAPRDEP